MDFHFRFWNSAQYSAGSRHFFINCRRKKNCGERRVPINKGKKLRFSFATQYLFFSESWGKDFWEYFGFLYIEKKTQHGKDKVLNAECDGIFFSKSYVDIFSLSHLKSGSYAVAKFFLLEIESGVNKKSGRFGPFRNVKKTLFRPDCSLTPFPFSLTTFKQKNIQVTTFDHISKNTKSF